MKITNSLQSVGDTTQQKETELQRVVLQWVLSSAGRKRVELSLVAKDIIFENGVLKKTCLKLC